MSSAKVSQCQHCNARIYFLLQAEPDRFDPLFGTTITGDIKPGSRQNPIEEAISADGNIEINIERGTYSIVPKDQRYGKMLHKSHFATCPGRAGFRKGKR